MISAQKTALLVVDIQGKLANIVADSEGLISNTSKLIRCCQVLSVPILVLEQNPKGLGPTTAELRRLLVDSDRLEKLTFNALGEPEIKSHILNMNKPTWLVAGIEAHICVYQTVRGMINAGLQVDVIADCISARTRSNLDLAIDNMRHLGANISSVEMCTYDMLQSSQHSEFKDVLNIIK